MDTGAQLLAYEFMRGFMPNAAEKQMVRQVFIAIDFAGLTALQKRAIDNGLVNGMGAPEFASYSSWNYFAGGHLDHDDGMSLGTVTSRHKQV